MADNTTAVVLSLFPVSNTKDSIYLRWEGNEEYVNDVQGYRLSYQAVGSKVVQLTSDISHDDFDYDITQLHENTYYKICINVYSNSSQLIQQEPCIKATTSTDSLSVALGSTFGAFLALGIIVFFVFIAKWQHTRKQQRHALQQVTPSGDSYESMAQQDGEYEMSEVSMQVHDETARIEFSDDASQLSGGAVGATAANGVAHQPSAAPLDDDGTNMNGDVQGAAACDPTRDSIPTVSIEDGRCSEQSSLLPPPSSIIAIPNMQDGKPIDVRPKVLDNRPPINGRPKAHSIVAAPDARPKKPALIDLTNTFSTSMFVEPNPVPGISLKPNLSCNW